MATTELEFSAPTHTLPVGGEMNPTGRLRGWLAEVQQVCESAANGNLEVRLLHLDENPDVAAVGRSINHLLDMTDAMLREAGASLTYASEGKYFRRVLTHGMLGSFRSTCQVINRASDTMATEAEVIHREHNERFAMATKFEENLKEVMGTLTRSSQSITETVKLISQIAAQTKMLALNATIEAARAGAAGAGFGVVADEVKELAKETARAASQIIDQTENMKATAKNTSKLVADVNALIRQMDTNE